MKLTKDTLIEGQIIKKGTEVRIKESSSDVYMVDTTTVPFMVKQVKARSRVNLQARPNKPFSRRDIEEIETWVDGYDGVIISRPLPTETLIHLYNTNGGEIEIETKATQKYKQKTVDREQADYEKTVRQEQDLKSYRSYDFVKDWAMNLHNKLQLAKYLDGIDRKPNFGVGQNIIPDLDRIGITNYRTMNLEQLANAIKNVYLGG